MAWLHRLPRRSSGFWDADNSAAQQVRDLLAQSREMTPGRSLCSLDTRLQVGAPVTGRPQCGPGPRGGTYPLHRGTS